MLQIGPITIDFTELLATAAVSPLAAAWYVFLHGGWVAIAFAILIGLKWRWQVHIARAGSRKWKWVLLGIDVPAENIQGPKAVENILAHLAGAHQTPDLIEKWITGFSQEYFSLEIASVNGFVRFYIYTPVQMRDLVEASIYAQYPTAEIHETEDYTKGLPSHFPNNEWDLWGTEFILTKHHAYPIRTYEAFHDETAEEATFKDPMAALLETMGSMRAGEQLWMQIIVTPISHRSWQHASFNLIEKLAGIPAHHEKKWWQYITDIPGRIIGVIVEGFMPSGETHEQKQDALPSKMLYLTSGERAIIESLEEKAAKTGFNTKIRVLYVSRKESTNKARGRFGIIGALKQFTDEDLNSLKPELHKVGTHAHYYFKDLRKNWKRSKVMHAYKVRSNWRGMLPYVLNVEEIATLWHFPISESVKAPLIKKSESKRAEPPYELPTLNSPHHGGRHHGAEGGINEGLPKNLPIG